jgi:hypothetical protein
VKVSGGGEGTISFLRAYRQHGYKNDHYNLVSRSKIRGIGTAPWHIEVWGLTLPEKVGKALERR